MPIFDVKGVDVFALVDADTDEAHGFTTHLNYWECLAAGVRAIYGSHPYTALLGELQERRSFRGLSGRGKSGAPDKVRELLLNAWISELRLNLIDLDDTDRLAVANHGMPVDAYYASSRAASAWLLVRDNATPMTHRSLLNGVSSLVTDSRLLPRPWDRTCTALKPTIEYGGFLTRPGSCSNLASGGTAGHAPENDSGS